MLSLSPALEPIDQLGSRRLLSWVLYAACKPPLLLPLTAAADSFVVYAYSLVGWGGLDPLRYQMLGFYPAKTEEDESAERSSPVVCHCLCHVCAIRDADPDPCADRAFTL